VFDLPERLLRTTEHRAFVYRCASCGLRTKAEFAAGVISPTQYGERVRAAAVYLNVQQLLPEARTAQALSDLIGAQLICAASVTGWARDKAQTLEPVYRAIGMGVAEAKLRCLDDPSAMLRTAFASPARPNGCTRPRASAIRSTGSVARAATFPRGLRAGFVVHDHFRPYAALDAVDHAFCNAHHRRELQALIDIDKAVWALDMRAVLLDAAKAVRQAKEAGESALGPQPVQGFVDRSWQAVRAGFPSIARCRPSTRRRTRKNDKSSVPATISSSASRPSRTRPCASWSTSTSHSPTTGPNRTCA
jgi:transposase